MVELYQSGDLKLDELITTTYTLDQVNQGYRTCWTARTSAVSSCTPARDRPAGQIVP